MTSAFDAPRVIRSVATAFLRRRPFIVAPLFALVLITLAAGAAPAAQMRVLAVMSTVAMSFFLWEAWRGRRRLVRSRGLFLSLLVTLLGIGLVSVASGGASSPLALMAFAPTVVGFAAFGRGRRSDALLVACGLLFAALALLPPLPLLPPLADPERRFLTVVAAIDALVLLRLGVTALTDAHASASRLAEGAGVEVVASAAARVAAIEAMGAKVAHEVRNPLSAIRGLVEVMAEHNNDERERRRLAVVLGEVTRIDEILTGYLALARPLDRIEPTTEDLAGLVREVAELIEARAQRAGVALSVEVEPAPIWASVDPRRLKEALLNVALNALDATPPEGQVQLQVRSLDPGPEILVRDSGTGMTPERLAAVGTPFVSGRPGGTGLGLALARQVLEQHGGSLELTSTPGQGTLARLRLPAPAGEPA